MAKNDPAPKTIMPGTYLHTKSGNLYKVLGVALHSETMEQLVIYRPLYDSSFELFARPYDMFVETIEIDGKSISRFQKVDN